MEETARDVYLEDEIDLRKYAQILIRNWRLIAAATFLAAASALVVSLLLPPSYEATALVAMTGSRYQLQFDPRFEVVPLQPPEGRTLQAIATADEVLQLVLAEVRDDLQPEEMKLDALRGMLEAEVPSNTEVLELKATARSGDLAARIANTWGEAFTRFANDLMIGASQEQEFFATQVADSEEELQAAEDALIDFQSENEAQVLRAHLGARSDLLNTYLAQENTFTLLLPNIEDLQRQVESLPQSESTGLGDDLAALGLQIQALNASSGVPIQVQLSEAASLSGKTAGEQARYLANLQSSVARRLADLEVQVDPLREEILSLQAEIEAFEVEGRQLSLERDMARQNMISLSNKLEEAKIEAQKPQGEVRLASRAAVPTDPASPRKLLNTVVAGAVGAMVGVAWAFLREWWSPVIKQQSETEQGATLSRRLAADR